MVILLIITTIGTHDLLVNQNENMMSSLWIPQTLLEPHRPAVIASVLEINQ